MSDLARLKALLLDRVEALVDQLNLPSPSHGTGGSHRRSRELRFGKKGSLAIHVAGRRAGTWRSFEDGIGGDLIALIAWAKSIRQGEAIAWARDWLGVPDDAPQRASARRPPPARSWTHPGSLAAARSIWRDRLDPRGSPVERYLAGRGLALPDPAPSLGYAAELDYRNANGQVLDRWPALLAAIQGPDGRLIGVHRTYLAVRRDGNVRKAPVPATKKVLGTYRGGAVRLAPTQGPVLALAEGIETGLAVAQMTGWPVWSVIAVDNFRAVVLPESVHTVILCGDGDEPDLAARIAAGADPMTPAGRCLARAAGRFRRQGREVRLEIPPQAKRDWNDVLRDGSVLAA